MADFTIPMENGVNRSDDELRLSLGFVRVAEGASYQPDDKDRLYKIGGRTIAATLTSPQSTTPYGIRQFQFDTQSNQIVLLANSQLYRQTAATTLGAWTSVNDLAGSPAPFLRSGIFLKAVPDGLNRWVTWTGAQNERPLIHDEDGNVRFLSLKWPERPTLTSLTTIPTAVRPTSTLTPTSITVDGVTTAPSGGFSTPTNAYDNDFTTQATATRTSAGVTATTFSFASTTYTSQTLYVHLNTSSQQPYRSDPRKQQLNSGTEAIRANMYVRVSTNSTDGTDGTWTQVYAGIVPIATKVVSFNLTNQGSAVILRVQVILKYFRKSVV